MAVDTVTRGELRILGKEGDTTVAWDRNDEDEVRVARETFNRMTGEGFLAYKTTGKDDRRGEQMRRFDPSAERIVLVPALRGG